MDWQKLAEVLLAGGLAGLIGAAAMLWKTKRDTARDDRRQKVDESTGAATAAKNITDAAGTLVKLADEQVEEFKLQIRALQSEIVAFNTRLDIEIQKRLRAEARESVIQDQVTELREKLASMGAQFELADQERQSLRRENGAMKTKLFEMSVGVTALGRQVREMGQEPVYVMEVPVDESRSSGRLGAIDQQAVKRFIEQQS